MKAISKENPGIYKIEYINDEVYITLFENIEQNEDNYLYDEYYYQIGWRDNIEKDIEENTKDWLELAKNKEKEELAYITRIERNKMLDETDKYMAIDRMNYSFPEEIKATNILTVIKTFFQIFCDFCNNKWGKYRQKLRDISKQPGFPYEIEWPHKPEE